MRVFFVSLVKRIGEGVGDRDSYQWEVLASKSLTIPYKNNGNLLVSRKYSGTVNCPEFFEDFGARKRVEKWQFSDKFGRISG